MWDVFLSHASEDKESVARPLALALEEHGIRVWFDTQELNVGDSLLQKLTDGLEHAQFGLLVLSASFFKKKWTQVELDTLVSLEHTTGKLILPVWHELTDKDIQQFSPDLASKMGVSTRLGLDEVLIRVLGAIRTARGEPDDCCLRFRATGVAGAIGTKELASVLRRKA
jgi:hypothetical protein